MTFEEAVAVPANQLMLNMMQQHVATASVSSVERVELMNDSLIMSGLRH